MPLDRAREEALDRRGHTVFAIENRRARHQYIGARFRHQRSRLSTDPAVHFDLTIAAQPLNGLPHLANLAQRVGNELLAAKARIHGHHEHELQAGENFGKHGGRRGGIQGHTRLLSQGVDVLNHAVQVRRRLLMNNDGVSAGRGELFDEIFRRFDHQMSFERQACQRAQSQEGWRAKRNVGDKAAVHHVNLNAVGARRFDGVNRFTQAGEISG